MKSVLVILLTLITGWSFAQELETAPTFKEENGAYMTINVGGWIPTGEAALLGVHPAIGFEFGAKGDQFSLGFAFDFRLLDAPNIYVAFDESDTLSIQSDTYKGGYYGLELGYNVINKEQLKIQLLGVIGVDGFTVRDIQSNNLFSTINSFSYGGGIKALYFISETLYFSGQATYNVFQYDTNGGTDLSGNGISFKLGFGGIFQI